MSEPYSAAELEALRLHIEAIGEPDDSGDGYWLAIPHLEELGSKFDRAWIHTTRDEEFVRFPTKTGKFGYNARGALRGAKGHPRFVQTHIGGVFVYRHRAMALAAGLMTLEQYRDPTKFYVDHIEPRKPDAVPNDRPENLRVGPPSANRNNPRNKKPVQRADGKPVTLMRKTPADAPGGDDAEGPSFCEHLTFPSIAWAAKFLGLADGRNLSSYVNGGAAKTMPDRTGDEWDAALAGVGAFACADAVRIPGVPEDDDRRISPTLGLLRAVGEGAYRLAGNRPTPQGYLRTKIAGVDVLVSRLVFKTFKRAEFDMKLASMPTGTDESELEIDHIDGDPLNNALENLRAVDWGEHNSKHSAAIDWVDGGWVLGTYDTAAEAARSVRGVDGKELSNGNILKVCDGDYWQTGGRKFEYADAKRAAELKVASAKKKRKIDEVYDAA